MTRAPDFPPPSIHFLSGIKVYSQGGLRDSRRDKMNVWGGEGDL